MPIYEYACPKCGEFEVTQRITENPLKKCPTCKSKVRKLISNTSFQLKGSGWYVTDYAKKGTDAGASKEPTASKDASASKESGTPADDGGAKSASGESKSKEKPTKAKKETAAKAA